MDGETTSVCPTNMFPVFLCVCVCVCDGGPLKVYSSVLLMCFMSQGRALARPMDSFAPSVFDAAWWRGEEEVMGKHHLYHKSIHFSFI